MVSREVIFPNIQHTDLSDYKELGTGCFGRVITSVYKPIGTVTVKFALSLRRTEQDELQKEFEHLIRIGTSHPNIVKAYGLIQDPIDGKGLVMEYIAGGTLDALFQRRDLSYKVDHIVFWMAQMASAVAHMHTHGIIHRDLKPINMLLDPSYTHLKICDFGFARVIDQSMSLRTGSWFWMAPEVMISGQYDTKCDVFSLGIVLWQLTSREKPYSELKKVSEIEYMQMVGRQGVRPRKLGCIAELEHLMEWCWESDPSHRPSSSLVRDTCTEMCRIYTEGLQPPMDLSSTERLEPPIGAYDGQQYLETTVAQEDLLSRSRKRDNLIDLISSRRGQTRLDPPIDIPKLDRPVLTDLTMHALSTQGHSNDEEKSGDEEKKGMIGEYWQPPSDQSSQRDQVDQVDGEEEEEEETLKPREVVVTESLVDVMMTESPHVSFGETTICKGRTPLSSLASPSGYQSPYNETTWSQNRLGTTVNYPAPSLNTLHTLEKSFQKLTDQQEVKQENENRSRASDSLLVTTVRNEEVEIVYDAPPPPLPISNGDSMNTQSTIDSQPLIRPIHLDALALKTDTQLRGSTSSLDTETPSPKYKYVKLVTSPTTMIQVTANEPISRFPPTSPFQKTPDPLPSINQSRFPLKTLSNESLTIQKSSPIQGNRGEMTSFQEYRRQMNSLSPMEKNNNNHSPTDGKEDHLRTAYANGELLHSFNTISRKQIVESVRQNKQHDKVSARVSDGDEDGMISPPPTPSKESSGSFEERRDRERHESPLTPGTPSRISRFTDFDLIQRVMAEQPPDEPIVEEKTSIIQVEDSAEINRMSEKERKEYLQQFEQPTIKPTRMIARRIMQFEGQPITAKPNRLQLKEDHDSVWIQSRKVPKSEFRTVGQRAAIFEQKGPILPSFK